MPLATQIPKIRTREHSLNRSNDLKLETIPKLANVYTNDYEQHPSTVVASPWSNNRKTSMPNDFFVKIVEDRQG